MVKKVFAVVLGVLNAALLSVIIISLATGWRFYGKSPGAVLKTSSAVPETTGAQTVTEATDETALSTEATEATSGVTEAATQPSTEAATKPPTQPTTQPATKPATQPATQPATKAPEKLPYEDGLSAPRAEDYAWVIDAKNNGKPSGATLLNTDGFIGKWKAEFIFDGIWEMVYITIDRNAKITVQPYQINYGKGWEYEADSPAYSFSGSFDIASVNASGEYGTMSLYLFYESGSKQYGIGTLKTKTGNTATVGLIRP